MSNGVEDTITRNVDGRTEGWTNRRMDRLWYEINDTHFF